MGELLAGTQVKNINVTLQRVDRFALDAPCGW